MKKIKQLFTSALLVITLISCQATGTPEEDSGAPNDNGGKVEIPENHTIERGEEESSTTSIIGAREVKATSLSKGTLFAAVNGAGESCEKENPCTIRKGFSKVKAGDVLFLRGGTYQISSQLLLAQKASKDKPIIIESYPGEKAIIEGKFVSPEYTKAHQDQRHTGIKFNSAYVTVRKVEIRYMGYEGAMFLYSSNNTIEGCNIHHNMLSGVVAYGGTWNENDAKYAIPYKYGYNTIKDNIVHHNSDAGMNGSSGDGGNADGISISSGRHNRVVHNTAYANSDDGIDTWRSNDTYVGYNIAYDNGRLHGDGNGIKAGGNINKNAGNGRRTIAEYNIAYNNRAIGFDYNVGRDVTFRYNTAYNNKSTGFRGDDETDMQNNIAYKNRTSHKGKEGKNNSWNKSDEADFVSVDPKSKDFLRPKKGSAFENMGAVKGTMGNGESDDANAKIFMIGDSTVHNNDFPNNSGGFLELGWGDVLGAQMKNSKNAFNEARSGASSKSYKTVLDRRHDWEETKELMANTDTQKGAYLLVQFGHNDESSREKLHTDPGVGGSFYTELKVYLDEAKEMGITPVLVTPVQRQYKGNHNHIGYAQTVRDLAKDEGVLLLDLSEKSFNEFNKYSNTEAIHKKFGYDDHTHFNPEAASIVASWVKALACGSSDKRLCNQFK